MAVGLAACNDFLDENRYPIDEQSNNPAYWSNTDNCDTQIAAFYNLFTGYGTTGNDSGFYFQSFSDDQCGISYDDWVYQNPPSSSTNWSSPFEEIRRADYIIVNVADADLTDVEKAYYIGVARLMRAFEYYRLVQRYGDVQWFSEPADVADTDVVYGARDDRDMVMDSVLADLNFAVNAIPGSGISGASHTAWSNDLAQCIKSDICLWEGTFCKYRTLSENGKAPDTSRAQKFLNECVTASEAVMSGGYTLCDNYRDAYNSLDLAGNSEIIMYKHYETNSVMTHSMPAYTNAGSPDIRGITKDAFEAYLFLDGKPQGVTSYSDDYYYTPQTYLTYEESGKPIKNLVGISHMLAVRDGRLSATTDTVLSFKGNAYVRVTEGMNSMTGYTVLKFDPDYLDPSEPCRNRSGQGYTDAPVAWLPVVLCNFAEAKAELGTITQDDLDRSVNLMYARAGLPNLSVSVGFTDPKNALEAGVSDIIWETRRCRRCELIMDYYYRYWDLIRWHMLEKLADDVNREVSVGARLDNYYDWVDEYVDAATAWNAAHPDDLIDETTFPSSGDISLELLSDGHLYKEAFPLAVGTDNNPQTRTWDSKHYLYPIPTAQLSLNPNLTQNPGW